jgi:mannose-6-phosphate isomerase-like protein (cupin superfamily)
VRHKSLRFGAGFHVVFSERKAQAAQMTIRPGDSEGGPDNRHQGADQWLFVVSGTGLAIVGELRQRLKAGSLLLVQRGERHEIRNTGRTPLKTLNFYYPPAYRNDDAATAAGKRGRKGAR